MACGLGIEDIVFEGRGGDQRASEEGSSLKRESTGDNIFFIFLPEKV